VASRRAEEIERKFQEATSRVLAEIRPDQINVRFVPKETGRQSRRGNVRI
jgi:hypothetical protein